MNVVACVKVVPDDQDLTVSPDYTLDFDRARPSISTYDLNAVEEGVRLVEDNGGSLKVLTVGDSSIDDSKLKKNILSRGADDLLMVADEDMKAMDAHQTACALKAALAKIDSYDLILCGDGSADLYAQQVGAQLGQLLGIPVINCVSKITVENGAVIAERTLEHEVEILEIPMPAVISVTSDINLPRIAGMKQILAAGKKPAVVLRATDLEYAALATIEVLETLAPKETDRKHIIIEGDSDEAIAAFIANVAKVI
ncbi:MAG: putative electron transfer flavoprotein FixA [Actinobacteria bacterium]|nr:putative electron transfer flavoprotein FixA [Actinomycetota bacterium]